jgi:hypothetical protein
MIRKVTIVWDNNGRGLCVSANQDSMRLLKDVAGMHEQEP